MDRPYLAYKSSLSDFVCACSDISDLAVYLNSLIIKFNCKFKTNIGFYHDEILEGDTLKKAREIIHSELQELLENYHVDADPNGFGRSALKLTILGKNVILNQFTNKIDQIIYLLNGLLSSLDNTIQGKGSMEFYGLGDLDVIDWHIIWEARTIIKNYGSCSTATLKKSTNFVYKLGTELDSANNYFESRITRIFRHLSNHKVKSGIDIITTNQEFDERIHELVKKGYLLTEEDLVQVTKKGSVVNVWANYITKTFVIEDPK